MAVSINGIAFAVNIRLWGPQRSSEKKKGKKEREKASRKLGLLSTFYDFIFACLG